MAQGSIKKHVAKDGTISYRARADGGIDPATGRRRQVMKTFPTKTKAHAWLRDQQHRADRGDWVAAHKTTLAEWITEWLAGTGARGRRESTQLLYSSLLNTRVVPALGHMALAKLTPAALERFFRQQEQELKSGTVGTLYAVVRVCLNDAERLGLVVASPMRKVRAPSVPVPERHAWTPEQARQFRQQVEQSEHYALWLLLLTCGLRIGEVLALTWGDCDFGRELLHVRRTLTTTRAGLAIGETTKSGKPRTLPLPAPVAAALREQRTRVLTLRLAHADVWEDYDLVFPSATGHRRRPEAVRKQLQALCAAAGVPALSPHGLRHTAASLLSEHAPIAVAREVLGHSSLTITNTYIHATDAAKRAGTDALARLLTDEEASV
jgi:integrase